MISECAMESTRGRPSAGPALGRDVRFRGLLAPGSDRSSGEEDLMAVWRTTKGQRFQNYRTRFTVVAKTSQSSPSWDAASPEPKNSSPSLIAATVLAAARLLLISR